MSHQPEKSFREGQQVAPTAASLFHSDSDDFFSSAAIPEGPSAEHVPSLFDTPDPQSSMQYDNADQSRSNLNDQPVGGANQVESLSTMHTDQGVKSYASPYNQVQVTQAPSRADEVSRAKRII